MIRVSTSLLILGLGAFENLPLILQGRSSMISL